MEDGQTHYGGFRHANEYGFEVIEAWRLFDMPPDHVGVLIHPQSTIHSIVKFVDGSLRAHLSVTDRRLSILYALAYRDCIEPELHFAVCASNKTTKHSPCFKGVPA